MQRPQRLIWIAAVVFFIVALAMLFAPQLRQELAPQPVDAWVAIQVEGEEVASDGPVELPAGTEFRLFAVLEARTRSGAPVYYSTAQALEHDGRLIPREARRVWDRRPEAHVLWFTIEAVPPAIHADSEESVAEFRYEAIFRADWAQAWSVPGRVQPASPRLATGAEEYGPLHFGTAWYQVRVALYGSESAIRPRATYRSPGAARLVELAAEWPRATLQLTGLLGPATRVFGRGQLILGEDEQVPHTLRDHLAAGILFTREAVVHRTIRSAGEKPGGLEWRLIELDDGLAWGAEGAAPGDLLRVRQRVVILYRDRSPLGRLGAEDLGFDFYEGPAVRSLGEIFVGEGLVEWAPIGKPTAARRSSPDLGVTAQ